jgi:tripartite-type tricarboxylate transporter receptor subunit TctC
MKKRIFALGGLPVLCACMALLVMFTMSGTPSWSAEKEYPNKPVKIIISFPPGSSNDVPIRIAQTSISAALGVPVVIENKVGAGGSVGADFVANANPDGYTILVGGTSTLTIAPQTNPGVTYKYTDFTPVCAPTVDYITLSALSDAPFKTLDELIDYAKKNPGKLNCATAGMGTVAHFFLEGFKQTHGLDIVAVHYSGGAPSVNALLGRHVNLVTTTLLNVLPNMKTGRINLLVSGASKRLKEFPNVPTMAEKGFPKGVFNVLNGIFVSKKCSKIVIDKLSKVMEKTFNDPDTIEKIEKANLDVDYLNAEETQKAMDQEFKMAMEIIKKGGFQQGAK